MASTFYSRFRFIIFLATNTRIKIVNSRIGQSVYFTKKNCRLIWNQNTVYNYNNALLLFNEFYSCIRGNLFLPRIQFTITTTRCYYLTNFIRVFVATFFFNPLTHEQKLLNPEKNHLCIVVKIVIQ